MMRWFNQNIPYLIGTLLGTVAGFVYWQQIGCNSGTCAITSDPINSSIYGALMGGLVAGMLKRENKKEELTEENIQI